MARVKIGTSWQAFTTGANHGIASAEGTLMLYIGTAAPGANDYGIPYKGTKIDVGPPAQSWIKSGEGVPIDAITFTY